MTDNFKNQNHNEMENMTETKGMLCIQEERNRQIQMFTPEHDDRYVNSELKHAALAYIKGAQFEIETGSPRNEPPQCWPWAREWWKPVGGPVRMYQKAGALYLAEIERTRREFARRPFTGSGAVFAILQEQYQLCVFAIDSLEAVQQGHQPGEECRGAETITLTAQEIRHLAQFCGMVLQEPTAAEAQEERETEIVIAPWPDKGVADNGEMLPPHKHFAYLADSPEEGGFPLGSPNTEVTGGTSGPVSG